MYMEYQGFIIIPQWYKCACLGDKCMQSKSNKFAMAVDFMYSESGGGGGVKKIVAKNNYSRDITDGTGYIGGGGLWQIRQSCSTNSLRVIVMDVNRKSRIHFKSNVSPIVYVVPQRTICKWQHVSEHENHGVVTTGCLSRCELYPSPSPITRWVTRHMMPSDDCECHVDVQGR